jgi:hypothetical protein
MRLSYQRYLFEVEAQDPLILPLYKGSTLRGAFGTAFKRVVCALRKNECTECLLKPRCVFAYVFETSPPGGPVPLGMSKYEQVPHPFIIEPPLESQKTYRPGETLTFGLVLVGKAIDYLPYFVYTFDELGKIGLGKGRGSYRLMRVTSDGKLVYAAEDKTIRSVPPQALSISEAVDFDADQHTAVTMRILTPARIMHQRHLTSELPFHLLITVLLRRLLLLSFFHGGGEPPAWDHRQLIGEAQKVSIESNRLKWWDWERYSARQDVRMKMGGLVGEITYSGRLDAFLPLLDAGAVVHVGKGTSFGLGKYEIASVAGQAGPVK